MEIRKAQTDDIETIMSIYERARTFMKDNGNPRQWSAYGWPPMELILRDINDGNSYVCVNGAEIVGTFYYNIGHRVEPTYNSIENGEWIGGDHYGVVHRIASSGKVKGVGSFCLSWAYERSHHLRIDTHEDNRVMQNLLKKLGFVYCGHIYVPQDSDVRLAYEKI